MWQLNPSEGPYNSDIEEGRETHPQLGLSHKICISILFCSVLFSGENGKLKGRQS